MAKKRNRVDSRAHTACPICARKVHGDRGLKMHLTQVHPNDAHALRAGAGRG